MKKVLFVLALLLIPAMAFAGSATSRWDLTIGGYVKVELGYSDQIRANQWVAPVRESKTSKVAGDEYGNWFMDGVQTRLNFLIKGPDVWGMKSSAFIEGDFYGTGGTTTRQGAFRLRHAFIKLTDPNFEITFAGNTTQVFGSPTGMGQLLLTMVPWLDPGLSIGSGRVPQFNVEYFAMNRQLSMLLGVFLNTNTVGGGSLNTTSGTINNWTMAGPSVHGRIKFATDKLGKIGNDKFAVVVDGFWGKEKKVYNKANNAAIVTPADVSATGWGDKTVDSWGAHGSFFIPILGEKGGNKAGSVGFSAYGWIAQNPGSIGPYPLGATSASYRRLDGTWTAATQYGWGPQVYVYLTNNVMIDLIYSEIKANLSKAYKAANANNLEKVVQYAAILAYDPNPALKFTLSWDYNKVDYAGPAAGQGNQGKANVFKFAAFYFF